MTMRLLPLALAAACAATFGLAGCNTPQQAQAPVAAAPPSVSYANVPPGVTPPGFHLPQGKGCAGDVARWAAIQDNDLRSGHVSQSVYDQIQQDIARARAACSAGHEAEASGIVRASRARHGYPQG